MHQPIVSIIVPVYKAEKYLSRCVDSILVQTFQNWECILVNDGSPDNSGLLCDEYAEKDSRIKVIHKKNGGVSSARQTGLDAVRGEFVIHADSDDWLEPNMLEELVNHQQETGADVIVFDFYRVTNGNQLKVTQKPQSLDNVQVLKDIISGHLYACCWNKLIRRILIKKYGSSFPNGINLGEDKCFLASLLKNPVAVSYLPKPLYYYDASSNSDSLVRKITQSSMDSGFAMVAYLESILSEEYSDSIYEVKKRLKIRAIDSGFYSNTEIRKIFRDDNKRIISDVVTLKTHSKEDLRLFLYTIGFSKLACLFAR